MATTIISGKEFNTFVSTFFESILCQDNPTYMGKQISRYEVSSNLQRLTIHFNSHSKVVLQAAGANPVRFSRTAKQGALIFTNQFLTIGQIINAN